MPVFFMPFGMIVPVTRWYSTSTGKLLTVWLQFNKPYQTVVILNLYWSYHSNFVIEYRLMLISYTSRLYEAQTDRFWLTGSSEIIDLFRRNLWLLVAIDPRLSLPFDPTEIFRYAAYSYPVFKWNKLPDWDMLSISFLLYKLGVYIQCAGLQISAKI